MQLVHMPALGPTLVTEDYSRDVDEDYGMPETDDVDLPSKWASAAEREKLGFASVAKHEYNLRCGKAATALAGLRVAMQLLDRFITEKKKNMKGQRLGNRSQTALESHQKDVRQHAELYRRQYDALRKLGLSADDSRFKPLTDSDIKTVYTNSSRAPGLGESRRAPAWFWGGDRDADEQTARQMDTLTEEELRVRWFRAQANLERFTEEVDIGHTEMDRVVRTHLHMQTLWKTLAERQSTAQLSTVAGVSTTQIRSGRQAYAVKQAAICAQRQLEASKSREAGETLRVETEQQQKRRAGRPDF